MYLVTTGQREFWPEKGPVWLLAPGCCPDQDDIEKKNRWEIMGAVSDPFQDEDVMTHAYAEIWDKTDELILLLANRLNTIHDSEHSLRYWRTHIGIWALMFVTVIFDRYTRLLMAKSEVVGIQVVGTREVNDLIPSDTISFADMAADDIFNQHVNITLCEMLGISVTEHRLPYTENRSCHQQKWMSAIKKRIRTLLRLGYEQFFSFFARQADVLMVASYLPRWMEVALALKSRGKILPFYSKLAWGGQPSRTPINHKARNLLSIPAENSDPFMTILIGVVQNCLPKVFVEDYAHLCKQSNVAYQGLKPKAIYTANAFWFNELFKHWAAVCQERGSRLIGGSHGTVYFVRKHANFESFEVLLSDYYLTWGWSEATLPKLLPSSACKMTGIVRRPNCISGEGILYLGTTSPRHAVLFLFDFSQYHKWQLRFFKAIPEGLMGDFLVRPHREDHGWRLQERLAKAMPSLQFDNWNVAFVKRLKHCRLYVCDHLSTTFGEALAANVPTVLFWDETIFPISESAKPYVQLLRDNHIVHDSPEDAAEWVANVYDDPAPWWLSESCQDAVRDFCYRYARTSQTPVKDWLELLTDLAVDRETID